MNSLFDVIRDIKKHNVIYVSDVMNAIFFLQQENSDTILIETFHVCYNEFQSYWLSAQYISKGALLALGTFLAWETRHIKVPSLNDSKYIGFCVYNIVIVCALCVPVTFVLPPEKPTAKFIFTSVVCVFTTTLVLCILFVPKVNVFRLKWTYLLKSDTNNCQSCLGILHFYYTCNFIY